MWGIAWKIAEGRGCAFQDIAAEVRSSILQYGTMEYVGGGTVLDQTAGEYKEEVWLCLSQGCIHAYQISRSGVREHVSVQNC